jgi:hypothetical protein
MRTYYVPVHGNRAYLLCQQAEHSNEQSTSRHYRPPEDIMQKFTRPLTREVELGSNRLAFTFSEQGLAVRPVGSRRPPREISWGALLCHMVGAHGHAPSTEEVAAAVESLKKGEGAKSPEPVPAGEPSLPMS